MTSTDTLKIGKLIHAACIYTHGQWCLLFLREDANRHFTWHHEQEDGLTETGTEVSAQTIEEAMRLAALHWKNSFFKTVNCGFRYTLPERDEHGINAFFYQMMASYSSGNGIYYDETLGNNCYVQNASEDALKLWQRLKSQNRIMAQ